jgi:hypothetical protein
VVRTIQIVLVHGANRDMLGLVLTH